VIREADSSDTGLLRESLALRHSRHGIPHLMHNPG